MKLGLGFREQMGKGLGPVQAEMDLQNAILNTWRKGEHKPDGTHSDLTSDSFVNMGLTKFGGPWLLPEGDASEFIISPVEITADQHDYRPPYLNTALVLRLTSDASHEITGLFQYDVHVWRRIVVINVGNFDLVFAHNDAASTERYRFACPAGLDYTLASASSFEMLYDASSANWRILEVNQLTAALLNSAGVVRNTNYRLSILAGGAAGDHTLTGVALTDSLLEVQHVIAAGGVADLTAEFTITAPNTINNVGGTDTTGDQLAVRWVEF